MKRRGTGSDGPGGSKEGQDGGKKPGLPPQVSLEEEMRQAREESPRQRRERLRLRRAVPRPPQERGAPPRPFEERIPRGAALMQNRPVTFFVEQDADAEEAGVQPLEALPMPGPRQRKAWRPEPGVEVPRHLRQFMNSVNGPTWRPHAARSETRTAVRPYAREDYVAKRPVWPLHKFPDDVDLVEEGKGRVYVGIEVDADAGTGLPTGTLPYGVKLDRDRSMPLVDEKLTGLKDRQRRLWNARVLRTLITSPTQRTGLVWIGQWTRAAEPRQKAKPVRNAEEADADWYDGRVRVHPGPWSRTTLSVGNHTFPQARRHPITDPRTAATVRDAIVNALKEDAAEADDAPVAE